MKRFFKAIVLIACAVPCSDVLCQNGPYGYYNDALLFSQTQLGGSARVQGMGGVQIGLGGDVSNIMGNPAGLGLYNRSEISFSPTFNFMNSSARYFNNTTDVATSRISIDNFGIVINRSKDRVVEGGWRGGSFGISFNRVNNFNNEFQYRANNPNTSIIDYFLDASTGIPANQFRNRLNAGTDIDLLDLAFEHYLILPALDQNDQEILGVYDPLAISYPYRQSETVISSGAQNQWSFSYGGNYDDKIYFGGGLGITSINYRTEKRFSEIYVNENLLDFDFTEFNNVSGRGINATLGIIVKPIDAFRIGASIVTPTYFSLDEVSESSMNSNYYDAVDGSVDNFSSSSTLYDFSYTLLTPLKISGGAAYFFNKNGFISADIEYLNLQSNRLGSRLESLEEDNWEIRDLYNPVVNFRLGGEYRYEIFRFRVGAGYYGDPYSRQAEVSRARLNLSTGLGMRLPTFYIDLAVVRDSYSALYQPYDTSISTVPTAIISRADVRGLFTVGFNF